MKKITLAVALLTALLAAPTAHARPPYKKALADYYGPFLAPKLHDCQTCHVPVKPGEKEEDDRPHNAFGARLKAIKKELSKAGKKTDIVSRLQAIADEDSDGDGVSNLLEILSGRNPGDANDRPTAAELDEARKKLAAFQARKYEPWNPFESVKRPAVPVVKNDPWVRNPIDAFLLAEQEPRGLKPRPEAPKAVLLRRVYLDLIGLPPSPAELRAYLADTAPDAYEKVVDRLLASPRHGERWGRHWMDVWRYADWAGYGAEVRESREHIWHWRDWIVESLNADKSYDRMILEMLAADELAPDDPDSLRATGFLVRNWYRYSRDTMLEMTVEHTSKAFLAVTMNCARCHSHFFDTDISHEDYYRFRAFFEPYDTRVDRLPGEANIAKLGLPRIYDARPDAPSYLYVRGNVNNPDKAKVIRPGVPKCLGGGEIKIEPVTLPRSAYSPDRREFVVKETLAASEAEVLKARARLAAARRNANLSAAQLLVNVNFALPDAWATQRTFDQLALAVADLLATEARHQALVAGLAAERLEDAGKKDSDEWKRVATEATTAQRNAAVVTARKELLATRQAHALANEKERPAAAQKVAAAEKMLTKAEADDKLPASTAYTPRTVATYPQTSTGRRLALARWIADKQNPLTARVAVNHIWLRHFGSALVPSVFDFGQNGQAPTHPALLNWLAAEFTERGWSMKRMHRLIVTSSAYRMDSLSDQACVTIDRENRYLWRMNPRRMEAELVRDSVLYVGGQLDLKMGGPDIPYTQGLTVPRRSLYFQHAAEKQVELLNLFDAANITECYQRSESVIPQQALALSNSSLVLTQSRRLAARLSKTVGEQADAAVNTAFVKSAFEHVLGRAPSVAEQAECDKFLAEQTALLTTKKLTPFQGGAAAPVPPSPVPHLRARENLVHVLLNHNDFVTIR